MESKRLIKTNLQNDHIDKLNRTKYIEQNDFGSI